MPLFAASTEPRCVSVDWGIIPLGSNARIRKVIEKWVQPLERGLGDVVEEIGDTKASPNVASVRSSWLFDIPAMAEDAALRWIVLNPDSNTLAIKIRPISPRLRSTSM